MAWQREYVLDGVDPTRYFPTAGNWGPLKVPVDHYFVLGDNRDHTIDSREFGMVHASDVIGRIKRVLASHDGSCCGLRSLLAGIRWKRVGVDLVSFPRAGTDDRLTEG
jgi:signal peptidase I